jgi:predicted TIM-barrel fold metal-dependent hydrolase
VADRKRRFVDAHVHLWDLDHNDWYQFPQPGPNDFGLGLKTPFPDVFLWDDYRETVATVDLVKWVHVTAVTQNKDVEAESAWVAPIAAKGGLPYAIIGSVDLNHSMAEIEATLAREMRNPAYRGLRLLGGADYDAQHTHDLLAFMAKNGLVYDAVANTGGIATAARGIARHPDLTVVLEHTGWPLAYDDAHIGQWAAEMAEFAALPNTVCKLSGLGMTVHKNDVDIFRRFFDECIRLWGASRCMFASNFPVDLMYGTGAELFEVFEAIASGYSDAEAADLYAGTAERTYRI